MLEIPKTKQRTNETKDKPKRGAMVSLPYVKGISQPLARIFKQRGVTVFHKPFNTQRRQLVRPKDTTPKQNRTGVVYEVTWKTCIKSYIGGNLKNTGKKDRGTQKVIIFGDT